MGGCYCTGACRTSGICPVHGGKVQDFNHEWLPVIQPRQPMPPVPADGAIAICGACGLRIYPVMHYVCTRPDCGVFPQVTCQVKGE